MATEEIYGVKLGSSFDDKKLVEIIPKLNKIFSDVLKKVRPSYVRGTDLGRIYITHPELNTPITVSPRRWHKIDAQTILQKIEHVLTSKNALRVTDGFEIHVGSVRIPAGEGRSKVKFTMGDNDCIQNKKSMVKIKNQDNLCLPRAIAVGLAKLHDNPKYTQIKRSDRPVQKNEALQIIYAAGKSPDHQFDLSDVYDFEEILDVQIIVYSSTKAGDPIHKEKARGGTIFLYHTPEGAGHFDAIVSITGFLGVSYFCSDCGQGYNDKIRHK